jgi:CRISPR-associated protein Cmr1
MFLAGADGSTPELRAPSIKGALRFWWRAMNGHLSLDELKKQEAAIFGDTKKRSNVILRIVNFTKKREKNISLTPHHRQGYCNRNNDNCYFKNNQCAKSYTKQGLFFNFELKINFDENVITQQELEKLLKVTFLLGGFGKRSRRGFGSVKIETINKKEIVCQSLEKMNIFVKHILTIKPKHPPAYPFITNIEIGKQYNTYEDLLIKIGESSHNNKDNSIGFARKDARLSSPIYTSIIEDGGKFYPIITTLNNEFKNTQKQNDYKKEIL